VDDSGDESCCSAVGTAEVTCDSAACVSALAEVPVTWATAVPCALSAAVLVVGCGAVNGTAFVALAEAPAYPYIAAASWDHISA
jgi:hypothetical protein